MIRRGSRKTTVETTIGDFTTKSEFGRRSVFQNETKIELYGLYSAVHNGWIQRSIRVGFWDGDLILNY